MDDKVRIEDLFEVVSQPEYSRDVLLSLQTKYDVLTQDFVRQYFEGTPLNIPPRDVDYWLFHWEQFKSTEGNEEELVANFFNFSFEYYTDRTDFFDFFDDPLLYGQAREEAAAASSLFCVIMCNSKNTGLAYNLPYF